MTEADHPPEENASPFSDEIDFVAWLVLRGGIGVREFLTLDLASPEGRLIVKAIERAEQFRIRELEQLARAITGSKGGGS